MAHGSKTPGYEYATCDTVLEPVAEETDSGVLQTQRSSMKQGVNPLEKLDKETLL